MPETDSTSPLYTTEQAATYLGLKPNTLEIWRLTDKGPAYIKLGTRVRYRVAELDAYLNQNTRGKSLVAV